MPHGMEFNMSSPLQTSYEKTNRADQPAPAQPDLRTGLDLFADMARLLPEPFFCKDLRGRYRACNGAFENLVGLTSADLEGKSDRELFLPSIARISRHHEERLLREAPPCQQYETSIIRHDGSRREVLVKLAPLHVAGARAGILGRLSDITRHKRTETALRDQQSQMLRITDNMLALVSEADRHGFFRYLTPSHQQILGFAPETLVGTWLYDLMHPDDLERMRIIFQVTLPALRSVRAEFRYRHADGHYIWLETIAKCTTDRFNRINGAVFASRDITERRQAELALREVNQTLQATIQASPQTIFVLDRTGCIQLWNPAAQQMFGWTEQEVLGKPYRLVPRNLAQEFRENLARMNRGEKFHNQETRRQCKNGTLLDISFSTAPLCDPHGLIIGTVGILADITERKRTEIALRESEELFRRIFEQNEDPAFLLCPHSLAILDVNAVAVRLFGHGKSSLRSGGLALLMKPDVLASLDQKFSRERQRLTDESAWSQMSPLSMHDRRGNTVMTAFRGRLLRSRGQEYLYGTFRDITEKLRIRKERNELQAKLIQANKMTALGTLASGIAHEINNPNNYLLTSAQFLDEAWLDIGRILREYAEENPDLAFGGLPAEEALKDIPQLLNSLIEGSRRIKNIVSSLKDFSRKDDSSMRRPFAINRVIEAALVILSNKIKKSTDHFTCQLTSSLPLVAGHYQKIEQVIINLVINAPESLPTRQAGVFLATALQEHPRRVVIKIRDQGNGIPPDILDRVFDPFFTTKQKIGGTGLGLSICYAIINDHRGTIDFESEIDGGTTATITLPVL
jgi:PAS domain S-box-containing protein